MTNWEKYKKELVEILISGEESFGVHSGKVFRCNFMMCEKCDFNTEQNKHQRCSILKSDWLDAKGEEE